MNSGSCWKCGQPSAASLFCQFCNTLQPPETDYYRFLGLERRLSLNPGELQDRFYRLSRQIHPDRFLRGTPHEQRLSLEAAAILNDAYRTLRDPVLRAEYVLKAEGFNIGEQKSGNVPPELIEEVFELNMELEELRKGDASVRPRLEEARRRFLAMRDETDAGLERLFAEYDAGQDRAALSLIRGLLNRRRYLANLVDQVGREV